MTDIDAAKVVKVYPTRIWIENDMMGSRHVMVQHGAEGMEPFTYASFFYDYAYTDNSSTHARATQLALALGATEPVEHRQRDFHWPTAEEVRAEIEERQKFLATLEKKA